MDIFIENAEGRYVTANESNRSPDVGFGPKTVDILWILSIIFRYTEEASDELWQ